MFNCRSAKLRRRTTALNNLQETLQRWKDATTDDAINSLLSTKDQARIGRDAQSLKSTRKNKIKSAESEIVILRDRIARNY